MAETMIDKLAGMQSEPDEERQAVSTGDAAESPKVDGPYNQNAVYLAADPEQTQLMQDILTELQLVNTGMTEQLVSLEDQTMRIENGSVAIVMFIGFIAGALLMLGFWRGKH